MVATIVSRFSDNKTTKTVVGLIQSDRWEPPPSPTPYYRNLKRYERVDIKQWEDLTPIIAQKGPKGQK